MLCVRVPCDLMPLFRDGDKCGDECVENMGVGGVMNAFLWWLLVWGKDKWRFQGICSSLRRFASGTRWRGRRRNFRASNGAFSGMG